MKNILLFFASVLLLIGCKDDPPTGSGTNNPIESNSALPFVEVISTIAIENEPKVPASLKIYEQGEEVFASNIGIEFRGSTSFRLSDKKILRLRDLGRRW